MVIEGCILSIIDFMPQLIGVNKKKLINIVNLTKIVGIASF